MVSGATLLRPRNADVLRAELRRVAEESGMPLTFGGEVRSATAKLGAHTRHEAVSKARRARLLP